MISVIKQRICSTPPRSQVRAASYKQFVSLRKLRKGQSQTVSEFNQNKPSTKTGNLCGARRSGQHSSKVKLAISLCRKQQHSAQWFCCTSYEGSPRVNEDKLQISNFNSNQTSAVKKYNVCLYYLIFFFLKRRHLSTNDCHSQFEVNQRFTGSQCQTWLLGNRHRVRFCQFEQEWGFFRETGY